jgi:hypothetical protein
MDRNRKEKIKKKFGEICEIVKWLDEARWCDENQEKEGIIHNGIYHELMKEDKKDKKGRAILVHWLCYITDYQKPFEEVWYRGGQIFSELVRLFYDSNDEKEFFIKLLKYKVGENKREDEAIPPFKSIEKENVSYAPRYWDAVYGIFRTLYYLKTRKTNMVEIIQDSIDSDSEIQDNVNSLARTLYKISYWQIGKAKSSKKEEKPVNCAIKKYWRDKSGDFKGLREQMEQNISSIENDWGEEKRFSNKRLWAALRDYFKPNAPYNKMLVNSITNKKVKEYLEKYGKKFMEHFEFPGDIWNRRFGDRLIRPIAEAYKDEAWIKEDGALVYKKDKGEMGLLRDDLNFPKLIRKLYKNILWKDGNYAREQYYPEQMDISFEFMPNLCAKATIAARICRECCPFGIGSIDNLSKFCHGEEDKYCSVALYTCGYRCKCNGKENCELRKVINERKEKLCNEVENSQKTGSVSFNKGGIS